MDILGVVLAGGKSSRMGRDKALLSHLNHPSLLDNARQQLDDIHLDEVKVSGDNYDIQDTVSGIGPIGALLSAVMYGLEYGFEGCILVPVDMPFLTQSELLELRQQGEDRQQICFYRASILPMYLPINHTHQKTLQGLIEKKRYALGALLDELPSNALQLDNSRPFKNINTPQDWQAYCRILENEDN